MTSNSDRLLDVEAQVLSALADMLGRAAHLTESIEKTIAETLDYDTLRETPAMQDLQQLDLLRQMQKDLGSVLEHYSHAKTEQPKIEDLNELTKLCRLEIVREAIRQSLSDPNPDQKSSTSVHDEIESGDVQLF